MIRRSVIFLLTVTASLHASEPMAIFQAERSTAAFDIEELDRPVQFIEPEFDPSLLENLPPPPDRTNQATLPRPIFEKDQWRGSLSGVTHPAHVIFRKAELWSQFWTTVIQPYMRTSKTPDVDFAKEMVVGVFAGDKPYANYQIQIQSIKPEQKEGEKVLVVHYRNSQQMPGVFNPPFAVQPFHLKKLPAFSGKVIFLEEKR